MNVIDRKWDIRFPEKLGRLFPIRTGYYFRVDQDVANKVLNILSEAYGIPAPKLGNIPKGSKEYAMYEYDTRTVFLYQRNHLRTIFHEFYHHLDNMTDGMYDSDDREGGASSFAWIFADRLWREFTGKTISAK